MIVTFTPTGYGDTLEFGRKGTRMGAHTMLDAFDDLLHRLRESKPNDRSEADRYHAIVITEVEKAKAVYMAYCQSKPGEIEEVSE